jgi:hypothetical protein
MGWWWMVAEVGLQMWPCQEGRVQLEEAGLEADYRPQHYLIWLIALQPLSQVVQVVLGLAQSLVER